MLADIRETDVLRGYHVIAALYAIADSLAGIELWCLGGEEAEEKIALRSFVFDTGVPMTVWRPAGVPGEAVFDLYLSVAHDDPVDEVSRLARRAARRSIIGLLCAGDGAAIDGHDTAALGRRVVTVIRGGTGTGLPG